MFCGSQTDNRRMHIFSCISSSSTPYSPLLPPLLSLLYFPRISPPQTILLLPKHQQSRDASTKESKARRKHSQIHRSASTDAACISHPHNYASRTGCGTCLGGDLSER